MNNNKLLKYGTILLIVLLIVAVVGKKQKWFGSKEEIDVYVEPVQLRNIVEIVSASGKVQPEKEVKISPDVSGEIVELFVIEGQQVKKGDLLCKIRPDLYETALNRVGASLNTSKANLSNAIARLAQVKAQFTNTESTYSRNKKLIEQNVLSQADFDASKAQYEAAKADIEAAQENVNAAKYTVNSSEASLKEANDNLSRTEIFAPVNGTISKLSVEKGERVVGTSQMAGTEIMRIANLNEMEVNVDVNENDIVKVSLSDTADIEVDAYLGRKFTGVVTEISNSANTIGVSADQVTNFTVKVRIVRESYTDLLNKKENYSPFRPGMSAAVDIKTNTVKNVLAIPVQSVITKEDTLMKNEKQKIDDSEVEDTRPIKVQEYVFLNHNGEAKLQKVNVGIQDNDYIQVLDGLTKSQVVIAGPYAAISKTLKNGKKIKLVAKEDLYKLNKED